IVGKLEEGMPEDDPRNPAVIADNVGDNVGDVAGMGADLLESFVGALVAALVVGIQEGRGLGGVTLSLLVAAMGVAASLLSTSWTAARARFRRGKEASLLRQSFLWALALTGLLYVGAWQQGFLSIGELLTVFLGIGCALWVGFWADYFTAPGRRPVRELVQAAQGGAATQVLGGLSLGMMSTALPMLGVAGAALLAYGLEGLFGVALAAVAMLSLTGAIMAVDAYGPVADNAGGIAAMAGLAPEVRQVTDELDALGNTTAAVGKGLAVGSAALTALALFSGFAASAGLHSLSLLEAPVLTGLLLGAIVPYGLAAHSLRAVQRAAAEMVQEVRRQWRTIPGLKEGRASGDAERCIAISSRAALREMAVPVLAALGLPLLMGLFLGAPALGGFLAGALSSGLALAITMAHAGAAWDNAKKAIEGGEGGGPLSPAHKAAVVGDMVGDPFKDTAGPSLNILIKIMSVVALLLAPFLV
ncbi:MAG: sodium-translocating pyrophosphatase, partial [Bacillota bacterium]|nr:sodium-translocating pyrophosphatase [Bacillota bacterium]